MKKEIQEVTASLAAAKEINMTVLFVLDGIFTLKEEQNIAANSSCHAAVTCV